MTSASIPLSKIRQRRPKRPPQGAPAAEAGRPRGVGADAASAPHSEAAAEADAETATPP